MALQLGFTDANSGAPLPAAYLRINSFSVDRLGSGIIAHMAVYYDKASFDAGKAPAGSFNADLSAAYAQIVSAAPTAQEVGVADLMVARAEAILHTLSNVTAGANTLDLTQATIVP